MKQRLLPQGGTIAVVSPSGSIASEFMDGGVNALRSLGYNVELMPNAKGRATSVFSATDAERASDLALALSRPDIDAVWCARGGYGAMRTLMALEPYGGWQRLFSQTDKLIVGFSDITALHSASVVAGGVGILGPMLKHIVTHGTSSPDVLETLRAVTEGCATVSCSPRQGSTEGRAEGRIIGGNLSILYSLLSTPICPDPEGAILFIEDLSEYRYHIDRMVQALRFSGFLSKLAGVVVGQMTGMRDGATSFGRDAYQIVADAVAPYGYPVLLGSPSGHAPEENYPIILGSHAVLDFQGDAATLSMTIER